MLNITRTKKSPKDVINDAWSMHGEHVPRITRRSEQEPHTTQPLYTITRPRIQSKTPWNVGYTEYQMKNEQVLSSSNELKNNLDVVLTRF